MSALAESTTDDLLRRGRIGRMAWLMLGLLLVCIGVVGIFVPLLPTTDFLILALPCFARSSPRLEAWLLNHPRFGAPLRAWREQRAIPRRGKFAACFGIAMGYGVFWLAARPGLLTASVVAAVTIASAAWIVTRPLPGEKR
jgi:uncharacterized membrane protein YbaN (DUF454 family)